MHAIERGAEENRSVCVCVREREGKRGKEKEVVQWLMHNDNKKGHNIITYMYLKVVYTRTYLQHSATITGTVCT